MKIKKHDDSSTLFQNPNGQKFTAKKKRKVKSI